MAVGTDRLLFIHVPKTGGSWAIQAMRAAGVPLAPERSDKHHIPLRECDVRGRFTFGCVREPLSWWRSQYHYRRRVGRIGDVWWHRYLDLSFEEFLRRVTEVQPGAVWRSFDRFLSLEAGGPDYVGRMEHLADDCVAAARLVGHRIDEDVVRSCPRRNVSVTTPAPDPPDWLLGSERKMYERFYPALLSRAAA
jgi:hypothetical protein